METTEKRWIELVIKAFQARSEKNTIQDIYNKINLDEDIIQQAMRKCVKLKILTQKEYKSLCY